MALKGLERARAAIRALPVEVRKAIRAEMGAIAAEMVAAMRLACPKDTGELAASIGWTWGAAPSGSVAVTSVSAGDLTLTIYAGSQATMVTNSRGVRFQKAKLAEFGTRNMPAQPYFFPVIRSFRRKIGRRINAAARRAARQAWGV